MQFLNFKKNIFSILVLAFTFLIVGRVEGQVSITSIGTVNNYNFNGMSSSATASLPTGWKFGLDWSTGTLQTTIAYGTTGTGVVTSTSSGAAVNWANGILTSSTDRAIGFITSGSITSPRSIILAFTNNTGSLVNSISLSWNYEKYRSGSRAFDWTFFHGNTSSPNTAVSSGNLSYASDPDNTVVYNPPLSASISATISGLSIPNGSTYYLRWTLTGVGGSSNGQGLGIDDINLTLNAAQSYTVIFDPNGGSGTMASQTSATAANLSANTFTRSGFTFTGWNTAADGSGTSYSNQASYTFTSSVTLYAQWCPNNTWIGGASGNFNTAANWCGGSVPAAGSNLTIPANTTITLDGTNEVTVGDLTISATGSLILPSNAKLTVNGTLTNNGTMTIESGATFVQGTLSSIATGTTGTFNVKQELTNCANNGTAPTGRYWYMGVPINSMTRGAAFGAASGLNRLWSWSESGQAWSTELSDATVLSPTTGYVYRTGSNVTLNFSGTSLYSTNASISNLTNTAGSFSGCQLISNPYTAYLDWDQISAASTNLSTTVCVRSYNTSSSQMVYDTYNATSSVSAQNSSYAVSKYIAPMQSFWVIVNPGTTGTINMTKAMLSHQPTAPGLKDLVSNSAFARLNLVSGTFSDQLVVYTDANATAELEDYDSKKLFLPNVPQVYCKVGNDKLVINALKKGKAHTTAPLTLELPTTQVYQFEMVESFVENGIVLLEDKLEGIFQDMGVNPIYEFYGTSGVLSDRFVLHFQHPNIGIDEGQAGVDELANSTINVFSNQNGIINVSLSSDLTATGEVQILDASGRLIQTTAIKGQETKLQITEGMGVYFVRVLTPMKSEMKKVMVY